MTNIWKYSCSGIWGTALKPDLDDYEPVFVQEAAKKKKKKKFESLFTLVAWRSNFFLESDFTIKPGQGQLILKQHMASYFYCA